MCTGSIAHAPPYHVIQFFMTEAISWLESKIIIEFAIACIK